MKKYSLHILVLFISSCLYAQEKIELQNVTDSLDYSLGVFVGNWIAQEGLTINKLNLFNQGIIDLMKENQLAVNDSTIMPFIASYQLSIKNERNRQMEAKLFSNLKGKNGVGVLPNGVHYIIIKKGDGIRPEATDSILYHIVGLFPDGTIFENTSEQQRPITNSVSNLIPGLSEAVQMMREGAVWRIFIPSILAYGSAGFRTLIPPNMALVYEISLEEVKKNINN